jgi:hypothetical protein
MSPARTRHLPALILLALAVPLAVGCASSQGAGASRRTALVRYLAQIEPLRLGVNRLLEGADPILQDYRRHRIGPTQAAARMGALERRFAAYTVQVAAIRPQRPTLRALHAEYAGTYVLEDAYLSALVSGLRGRNLADLPDTQAAQRATIIRWRTGLMVLAEEAHVSPPADLQQAGRGEIAPSPGGS